VADLPALLEHDQLLAQLTRARGLGFLGPGPVQAHIEHTVGFLIALEATTGTVVDLGSGGGVPGLVIGVARPDLALILVDARGARCRFLEEAVDELALEATVVEGRAELIGRGPLRGTADAVVARSFGPPSVTVECAAPLLRLGGLLIVSEPPVLDPSRWPADQVAALGMQVGPRSPGSPTMQVLRQVTACPAAYPRRDGLPAKRPLF
jgi:16S rRNA (guanine527-N7)-methyltransferase